MELSLLVLLMVSVATVVKGQLGLPKISLPDLTDLGLCVPDEIPPLKITIPFTNCRKLVKEALGKRHPDQNKITPEILETYGYPYQTHNVTTEDGYILTVYRITGSPNRPSNSETGQPVYLNHGMGAASDNWNFQPKSRNLPFKLTDAGYDVWMSNCRGTTYSQRHTDPAKDSHTLPYWDFSFHELAMYDVPAVINKILTVSKASKLFYIGHSMGTTQFFVSMSEMPELNDKIIAGFMLSPIAFLGHTSNPLRIMSHLLGPYERYLAVNPLFQGRLPSAQHLRQHFQLSAGDLCVPTALRCGLCVNLAFLFFGCNPPQMDYDELPNVVAKFPNAISLKTISHYLQFMLSCKFHQYDYGEAENLKRYKSKLPPDYKLENIRVPTYLYYGEQDNMGVPKDVKLTASKFKPGVIKKVFKVEDDLFTHADFVIAKDADKLLYDKILTEMKNYT